MPEALANQGGARNQGRGRTAQLDADSVEAGAGPGKRSASFQAATPGSTSSTLTSALGGLALGRKSTRLKMPTYKKPI